MNPERPQFEQANDHDFGRAESNAQYQANLKRQRSAAERQDRINHVARDAMKKLGLQSDEENKLKNNKPKQPKMF